MKRSKKPTAFDSARGPKYKQIELYGRWENKASAMRTRSGGRLKRECLSVFKLIEIYNVTVILQLNLLNT